MFDGFFLHKVPLALPLIRLSVGVATFAKENWRKRKQMNE
jgi:hypothetical protein